MGITLNSPSMAMKILAKFIFLTLALLATVDAFATLPAASPARQDEAVMRKAMHQFLMDQSKGLPGEVDISLGPIDPRLFLAPCPSFEVFLPGGNKAWGKTTVGVRCAEPTHWTIYVAAQVHVTGDYIAAVTPLAQGQQLTDRDIAVVHGDLTSLPAGIVTDKSQAIGFTVAHSVPVGMPLRQDALRSQQAVASGQVVRLVSGGEGFRVSAEGRALTNAGDGQLVQARTAGGQIVSGIAKIGGTIEVAY
jgi:flagella basal body P-ring formation protein FlgA